MHWQRGFKRLRLIGTVSLVLGAVLLFAVLLTQQLGYAPNPGFAPLFGAFWPLGLMLIVLGLLLWLSVWVLLGFLPGDAPLTGTPGDAEPGKPRFYR